MRQKVLSPFQEFIKYVKRKNVLKKQEEEKLGKVFGEIVEKPKTKKKLNP